MSFPVLYQTKVQFEVIFSIVAKLEMATKKHFSDYAHIRFFVISSFATLE
jgi:hypothetical protein